MEVPKKRNKKKIETARINIRLEPQLKEALEQYCTAHDKILSKVIKDAIRLYIGLN